VDLSRLVGFGEELSKYAKAVMEKDRKKEFLINGDRRFATNATTLPVSPEENDRKPAAVPTALFRASSRQSSVHLPPSIRSPRSTYATQDEDAFHSLVTSPTYMTAQSEVRRAPADADADADADDADADAAVDRTIQPDQAQSAIVSPVRRSNRQYGRQDNAVQPDHVQSAAVVPARQSKRQQDRRDFRQHIQYQAVARRKEARDYAIPESVASMANDDISTAIMPRLPKKRRATDIANANERQEDDSVIAPEVVSSSFSSSSSNSSGVPSLVQNPASLLPRPRAGYDGTIKKSKLRRSEGQPRSLLNKRLRSLGLTCAFGQPVVSSNGPRISHLTLNSKWNDLPFTEQDCLQYWLGDGAKRLSLASPLDPARYIQHDTGIPIFWAVNSNEPGGARCYYVGHWICVRFYLFDQTQNNDERKMIHKKKDRQALLEFDFVRFDENLARNME